MSLKRAMVPSRSMNKTASEIFFKMALREWVVPEVVLIRGVPKNLPYYAFPVPGGWNSVEEREDLPPGYLKKWHRIADYHSLYRNFNSAFKNVGGPRDFFSKTKS